MRNSDQVRKFVTDATAEIARYESLIRELKEKRQAAQRSLDSIIYPVLTLPPEITSEIFFHCLPTCADEECNTADADEAPLLLLRICRTWRKIAISTPALWASIELAMDRTHSAELFESWLARVGGCPISAKLSASHALSPASLATFVSHSCGMKVLELLEMDVATLQVMDEVASGAIHFSSLQKRTLLQTRKSFQWKRSTLLHAPLLREVSLSVATPSFLSLPWNQLTKFTGTVYTNEDCLEVLRLAPSLTECSFAAFHGTDDIDEDTLIVHSRLTSLTLFDATEKSDTGRPVCSTEILQFLTLPALQSLYIHCANTGFSDDVFHDFLSRSSPPLRKFAIRQDPVTNLDATSFLLMPGLLDLEMSYITTGLATHFFESFGRDTSFLPQLEHLSLLGCGSRIPEHFLYYMLLETVKSGLTGRWSSRGKGFAELKSFRLVCTQDFGDPVDELLDPFRDLAAEGLDMHIEGTREVYV
ncbi:hypothetical protein DFH06DRAFT_979499 [Mycena polygramma]|nr:hypothetical protein DFH06DRAFT_979499 [Mycena polygramma]